MTERSGSITSGRFGEALLANLKAGDDSLQQWSSENGLFFFVPRTRLLKVFPMRLGLNFGDLLSPIIVRALAGTSRRKPKPRMLALGSILHFAEDGDTVWGSGINGKVPMESFGAKNLLVRSVRGPLTRKMLQARGIACPEAYGDPALLLGTVKAELGAIEQSGKILVIPNYNDIKIFAKLREPFHVHFLSPLASPLTLIKEIAGCEWVITSSLHVLILGEVFQKKVRLVMPLGHKESLFKYEDYFEGTGRKLQPIATSLAQALFARDYDPLIAPTGGLLRTFPYHEFSPCILPREGSLS